MDVPATLLHLHHIPIPDDYDGSVLVESFVEQRPVESQAGDVGIGPTTDNVYAATESEEIIGHLRALGYVD
jgi:hypothetical protein